MIRIRPLLLGTLLALLPLGAQMPGWYHDAWYTQLLNKFPAADQGYGPDPSSPAGASREQPMTWGLVLSSEVRRYKADPSPEGAQRVLAAFDWIVANSDLDQDGKPGWGLPDPYDAFADGSTNPANQPYTITTAICAEGLLDAMDEPPVRGLLGSGRCKQGRDLLVSCWWRWSHDLWTDDGGGKGHFWYSPAPLDAHVVPNVTSLWAGVGARMWAESWSSLYAGFPTDLQTKVQAVALALGQAASMRQGAPFWPYDLSSSSGAANDLLHHAYIILGLEQIRDAGLGSAIPWTRASALDSLRAFFRGGLPYDLPQDVVYSGTQASLQDRPARLWGCGALLAVMGLEERFHGVETDQMLSALDQAYGPVPNLRMYPPAFSTVSTFYPRQASHVLWGLAELGYPAHPALAARIYQAPGILHVYALPTPPRSDLVSAHYFVDGVDYPANPSHPLALALDPLVIGPGTHRLVIQGIDANNRWAFAAPMDFQITP